MNYKSVLWHIEPVLVFVYEGSGVTYGALPAVVLGHRVLRVRLFGLFHWTVACCKRKLFYTN